MTVIGITGYAGTGKDTAALGLLGIGFEQIGYSDAINNVLYQLDPVLVLGVPEVNALGSFRTSPPLSMSQRLGDNYMTTGLHRWTKLVNLYGVEAIKRAIPEVRLLQQRLGRSVRDLEPDIWLNAVKRRMLADPTGDFVITGIRKANEVEDIHAVGGKVIRLHRPGFGPANGDPMDGADIDALNVDLCISNSGAPWELKSELVKYVRTLG